MSYRLVKITTFYPEYLRHYYARNPGVRSLPYAEQQKALLADGFAWADFLTRQFSMLGVDAHELILNAKPLQDAWAAEHGTQAQSPDFLLKQLQVIKPDVLFVEDPFVFSPDMLRQLRSDVPSLRQIIGWCCAPYQTEQLAQFAAYDWMVTCTPGFVDNFRRAGLKAHLSVHAFEPDVLQHIPQERDKTGPELTFLGSLIPGAGFHDERALLLLALADQYPEMAICGSVLQPPRLRTASKAIVRGLVKSLLAAGLPEQQLRRLPGMSRALGMRTRPLPARFPRKLVRCVRPAVFGLEMLALLARTKIGLNIHGEVAGRFAGNMRLFETTGVGTCLLTDWKQNMAELFEPDREVVVYGSIPECLEKVAWLASHPAERDAIARAGQARTLRDYTYAKKAEALDTIIRRSFR